MLLLKLLIPNNVTQKIIYHTILFLLSAIFLMLPVATWAGLEFIDVIQDGQGQVEGLDGASSVALSPDDQFLYVTGRYDDAITVFTRNLNTGSLVPIQVVRDGISGVDGLGGAIDVTVSGDGKSVYVASWDDDAVAVFGRDLDTGLLSFQQLLKDGQDNVDGLNNARSVTVSGDGKSVYVASWNDDAVAVFGRDLGTGQLTYQLLQKYHRLEYVSSVTVSGDGKSVYVVGNDAVAMFWRDLGTGQLIYQQAMFDNVNGVKGLNGANSVVVSPDDQFVYVASYDDDAIAIFSHINQAPLNILPPADPTIDANSNLIFKQLSINDPDTSSLPVQVTLKVTNGTLTLSTIQGLEFEQGDGTDDKQLTMTGGIAALNDALTNMIFKPTLSFSGEAELQIVTKDLGFGYGGVKQDSDTLTITVLSTNQAPVLEVIETQYGSPNNLLSFTVDATDPDVPKQDLIYELIDGSPPLEETNARIDRETGQFKWMPLPTQIGTFEFTVQVTDDGRAPDNLTDEQTFTIIITEDPVLDPIAPQTITVGEQLMVVTPTHFLGSQPLAFSLLDAPEGGQINEQTGVFTWTPTQTGEFTATVKVTEPIGNNIAQETFTITVKPIPTRLELELTTFAIFQNGPLTVRGWITGYSSQPVHLEDLPIQLDITAPDGNHTTTEVISHASGEYQFTSLPAFEQIGEYRLRAYFAGNERLAASESTQLPVMVKSLAGYALLVQGRDAQGNGQEAYGKSLNRVYQKLKNRGFVDENIEYFSYDEGQFGVDDRPDKLKVKTTLTSLPTRLNNDPAPLYIVMLDHGDLEGNFYLDNGDGERITPTELDNWLTTLEQSLNERARQQPRVIIIGSCYSGHFIPALSKRGRVIITSTAADEESYKGPKEPDEVRSGEYFMEALFAHFGRGHSLKTAFELATQSTELFTRGGEQSVFHGQYQDDAVQHPLLDDNHDRQGSNVLGKEGQVANQIYLGLGPRYDEDAPDNPAEIRQVTPTVHLGADQTAVPIWAQVNRTDRVKGNVVLVDIRPPSVQLTGAGTEAREPLEMPDLSRQNLHFSSGNEYRGSVTGFTEVGRYELFYFVVDSETGDRSALQQSLVYKDRAGNKPPTPVLLQQPTHQEQTATTVIFNWEKSTDPDGDAITYTFFLATDSHLKQIIYQQAGLKTAMTYLNTNSVINDPLNKGKLGLRDGTEYFWQVQARDSYGATSDSKVFSFQTNDTNFPPSLGSLYVYNAVNFVSLEQANIDFWQVDEGGNLILDENGLPIPVTEPPNVFDDQGVYNMLLPLGRRSRATIRVAGYEEQTVMIDTSTGLAHLQIPMTPVGGIPTQPGRVQFAVEHTQLEETQGEVALLVQRVDGADGDIAINYQLLPDDSSATLQTDYSLTKGQLTWADQDHLPKKILVTLHDDDQWEDKEHFTLQLYQPAGGATLGEPNTMMVTIIDDEAAQPLQPGVLQFETVTYSASEGQTDPQIRVIRTDGSDRTVSVQYLITNQSTATPNTDYLGGDGLLTWSNGDGEAKLVPLELLDDSEVESTETIHLILFNPTGEATLGEHQETILEITDNDVADSTTFGFVQFSKANYTAHEENGSLTTITVVRTDGNQGEVTIEYLTTEGSTAQRDQDYTGGQGLLKWATGDSEGKSLDISIIDDDEVEAAEVVQLQLMNPTGGVQLGSLSQATLTITDNDITITESTPPVTTSSAEDNLISSPSKEADDEPILPSPPVSTTSASTTVSPADTPTSATEPQPLPADSVASPIPSQAGILQFVTPTYYLNEGLGLVSTFTVTRSGGTQGAVTVKYTTIRDGTAQIGLDYVDGIGLLSWKDGENTPKAIELSVIDDSQAEGSETILVQLEEPTGGAQLGIYDQATLIIADNDESDDDKLSSDTTIAQLAFSSPLYWAQEEDLAAQVTVMRSGSSQGDISVQYIATVNSSATLGADYDNGIGVLNWADGEMQSQVITLPLLDDEFPEEELIHLVLIKPTGPAVLGNQNETAVVIRDDDPIPSIKEEITPTTVQFIKAIEIIAEHQGEILIPVMRTGSHSGTHSVYYETVDDSATAPQDYLPVQGRLTWNEGDNDLASIVISLQEDKQVEAEERFILQLFNPSEDIELGKLAQLEIRIRDNDSYSPSTHFILPNLGRGMVLVNQNQSVRKIRLNCQTLPCSPTVAFRGGSSVNGLSYHNPFLLHPNQNMIIQGEIDVEAEHVGQLADLLIVAAWQPLDVNGSVSYVMQGKYGQIMSWDLNLAHLVAAQEQIRLASTQEINLYTGWLSLGQIQLFFGYRLADGLIVFNGEQAIQLVIADM